MIKAPIQYYGGKGLMLKQILEFFPKKHFETFIDACGGSGSIILNYNNANIRIYNDIEKNVYTLYKVIHDPALFEKFRDKCQLSVFDEETRREYKKFLQSPDLDDIDRTYYFYYVSRTSRNGFSAFPIKTQVRRNIAQTVSRFLSAIDGLEDLHQIISNLVICNRNCVDLLDEFQDQSVFLYHDPPYWSEERRSDYKYLAEDKDKAKRQSFHEQLVEKLIDNQATTYYALSGYNNPIYKNLEDAGWIKHEINVKVGNGQNKKYEQIECLWVNYDQNDNLIFGK